MPLKTKIAAYSFGLNQILQYAPGKTDLEFCFDQKITNPIKDALVCLDMENVAMNSDVDLGSMSKIF